MLNVNTAIRTSYLKRSKLITGAIAAGAVLMLSACSSDDNKNTGSSSSFAPSLSIFDIAASDDRFESLTLALKTTGLDVALDDETANFTVFAPTDDAFAKLGDALNTLLADPETLEDILRYHVLSGAVDAATAISLAGTNQTMLNGDNISLSLQMGDLYINNAKVIIKDIKANNGIIHAIDTVIVPPAPTPELGNIVETAVSNGDFSSLVQYVQSAGLVEALSNPNAQLTVFAPTNAAFAKLPEATVTALMNDTQLLADVLKYHVVNAKVDSTAATGLANTSVTMLNGNDVSVSVNNGNLFINDSKVITPNVMATNGIIHAIDTVLIPPVDVAKTAINANVFSALSDALIAAGIDANTANTAATATVLSATGLDTVLANPNTTFTVFMPTAEAFKALGAETLNSLAKNTEQLKSILLFHTVAGSKIDAATAVAAAGTSLTMADGNMAAVTLIEGKLLIKDAQVVTTNVQASNGIIHFIDKVILP